MWRSNEDLLFLIFEELGNDKKSLYSCLLVNRTWCVTAVSILWRNPSLFSYFGIQKKLFNVILLLLSEESKEILKNQGMNNFITETTHQRPLFNYMSFWKHLKLPILRHEIFSNIVGESNAPILRNELFKLFINKNTKFIQLTITEYFDYQVHLIPGAECCLSGLEIFYYNSKIDPNVLVGLAKICKSIKKIEINFDSYENTDSHGIFKLIEVQKNLNEFYLTDAFNRLEPFYKYLEESLIKHADTIQYLKIDWSPNTRFLSYFVNLVYLEIEKSFFIKKYNPNNLKNISLPILKILKINRVPLIATVNLIESTTGNLSEISIHCDKALRDVGCKMLIQAIYQNCPNIRYLKLSFDIKLLIPEFKNLLINCKFLIGLIIHVRNDYNFRWNKLFQILAKSSPISLFKFKFYSKEFKLKDLKLFFDNWKNRRAMLLKIIYPSFKVDQQLVSLIEQYKAKGIIENYIFSIIDCGDDYENFKWI
ncbi:hypothetical protein RhiirC2_787872 [Rhizophagus irregularis]|uniref:F-box domain-containing protein n=1 Tax=Rhizophagus irregularis TaxID=588596 RepID=A0A2N1MRG3_9GLOM|nr:hypothetical protein RhiirC2_787872 [Rhizophagus irregularis]